MYEPVTRELRLTAQCINSCHENTYDYVGFRGAALWQTSVQINGFDKMQQQLRVNAKQSSIFYLRKSLRSHMSLNSYSCDKKRYNYNPLLKVAQHALCWHQNYVLTLENIGNENVRGCSQTAAFSSQITLFDGASVTIIT